MKYYLLLLLFCLSGISVIGQEAPKNLERGDFIKLTIFNKSLIPMSGYVEGPKKNGSKFSYGLNVGPFTKIKKYWSVGTKFYVKRFGKYELAYEVEPIDKGETVDIASKFKKRRSLAKNGK